MSPIVFQTSSVPSPIVFQTSSVRVLFEPYRIPNKLCSGLFEPYRLCSEPYRIPNKLCSGFVRALSYSKQALFGFFEPYRIPNSSFGLFEPIVFQRALFGSVRAYRILNKPCSGSVRALSYSKRALSGSGEFYPIQTDLLEPVWTVRYL
ncbi:hypothetical protein MAL04_20160 (plasmid) [Leptospira noguchii]|nr:hypothetical protein MAL04_20160 [Leptospira noguchii]